MPVDIAKALLIDGWMNEAELLWLAEQAQSHRRIVEIGCHQGRSTRALADNTKGKVWAVDVWSDPEIYARFNLNLGSRFFSTVIPVQSDSLAYAARHEKPTAFYDMIFIDADHSYRAVKADIEAWRPMLAPEGLLCGHDFGYDNHQGVEQAVRELIPDFQRVPGTSIWFTK